MLPIGARELLIVEGVMDDPVTRARAERLRAAMAPKDSRDAAAPPARVVDEVELNRAVGLGAVSVGRVGMRNELQPLVVLNRFRFDDDAAEQERRRQALPNLWRNGYKYHGYDGFHWRDSGSPEHRRKTGLICQPAWQIHLIDGCHFRCAYCNLSHAINIMLNVEEYVARLPAELDRCPRQTLFQYDNRTDAVCFEPEYGAARLLIEFFARRASQALELYVGKSDHVDFLLDFDHRGHTVCCWSLAGRTQTREIEWRSAPMEARIEAMRKCQAAGYPVRARFSPIVPVHGWREENRELIARLFAAVRPDVIAMEPIRFHDYDELTGYLDESLLDEEFLAVMKRAPRRGTSEAAAHGNEVPADYRRALYEFMIAECGRHSPQTPIAFCREARSTWEALAGLLARQGQEPDRYFCNCGPLSAPAMAGVTAGAAAVAG